MKYAFIEEYRTLHSVRRMCVLLEVSHSGYYEWRERLKSIRSQSNELLQAQVTLVHARSRSTYGRPRIHAALRAQGHAVSAKRIARVMRNAGIAGVSPRRFRTTTDSNHDFPIAANVVDRSFSIAQIGAPNRIWAGDITYLRTHEGWLYLAVVIDLYSRRVIGWSMSNTMHAELVMNALRAALRSRTPGPETIFHSDRGCQYASAPFRALLKSHGIVASMSRKGDCWDNAVVESFFGSMKSELRDPIWENRRAARAAIFDYIEIWYNRERLHSTLGHRSPEQFESLLPIAA